MRFVLSRANSRYYGEHQPWMVEKELSQGERYLIACFAERADAEAALASLARSIEVAAGAAVESAGEPEVDVGPPPPVPEPD